MWAWLWAGLRTMSKILYSGRHFIRASPLNNGSQSLKQVDRLLDNSLPIVHVSTFPPSLPFSLSLSLLLPPSLPSVERFTVLLQFMCSREVVDIPFPEFQDGIKAAVSYGFCLLTQLLQDKNSNVCARAKFCISNISDTSLKVQRNFQITDAV